MQVVRWREPAAFKRATRGSRHYSPIGTVIPILIAATILIARAVVSAPNAPGWPLMIVIAVGCGFALGVGMPALTSVFPSEVIVSPKGINRNGVSGVFFTIEFWPWTDINECGLESLVADGQSFETLVLYRAAGEAIGAIGFNSRPPLNELDAFLSQRGTRLQRQAYNHPLQWTGPGVGVASATRPVESSGRSRPLNGVALSAMSDVDWPFDQPRNCAVISLRSIVFRGAPILHVTHDEDDDGWQFLGAGDADVNDADVNDAAVISLEEAVRLDSSILELTAMPPGWRAWRPTRSSPWQRSRRPADGG